MMAALAFLGWIAVLVLVIALQVGAKRLARRMYGDDEDGG
jgi:hypothetical protein